MKQIILHLGQMEAVTFAGSPAKNDDRCDYILVAVTEALEVAVRE